MAIQRIQFRDPVSDDLGTGYARTKHTKYDAVEKGSWIIITPGSDAPRNALRVRVPMSNVVSISEDPIVEVVK